jgi:hypothetical protein
MRKILLATVLLALTSTSFAAHGPAGCGLGAMIFKDKEGLVMNVLAATFNGTSGNQTFGMSTGTLGCEDAATASVASVAFVEGNIVALSNDVAQGQGETLSAYLTIVNGQNVNAAKLQKNYANIFASSNAVEIDAKIKALL